MENVKNGQFQASGQTVLPGRSLLIGQKLVKNAKIEKLKCDILGDFQTLWVPLMFTKCSVKKVALLILYSYSNLRRAQPRLQFENES